MIFFKNLNADGIIDEDGTFVYMKVPTRKRQNLSKYAGISPSVVMKRRFMLGSGEDRRRDNECNAKQNRIFFSSFFLKCEILRFYFQQLWKWRILCWWRLDLNHWWKHMYWAMRSHWFLQLVNNFYSIFHDEK